MSIICTFRVEKDLLHVKASGRDDNIEDAKNYGLSVIDAAISNGVNKVICDETELTYTIGVFDLYELARHIETFVPKVAKIALVCSAAQMRDAQFYETVTVNRGVHLKVFQSADDALAWIG